MGIKILFPRLGIGQPAYRVKAIAEFVRFKAWVNGFGVQVPA